jgi:chromate transporter
VRKKRWLSDESFQDGAALCQSIPGATAMQTAAYVGLRAGGRGALWRASRPSACRRSFSW